MLRLITDLNFKIKANKQTKTSKQTSGKRLLEEDIYENNLTVHDPRQKYNVIRQTIYGNMSMIQELNCSSKFRIIVYFTVCGVALWLLRHRQAKAIESENKVSEIKVALIQ